MKRYKIWCVLILVTILQASCSITRHMPQGDYLLHKNEIAYSDSTLKKDRIPESTLTPYIKQDPNKRFLGTNLYLWIYNLASPDKNNMFSRLCRSVGQPYVTVDPNLIESSTINLKSYMNSSGYFNAKSTYSVDTTKRRKATITYHIDQGEPYRLGEITHLFKDKTIGVVIMEDSASTLIHKGDIFNESTLNEERSRISDLLKEKGYFSFGVDDIYYTADSTAGDKTVNIKMVVKQRTTGYTKNGEPILDDFTVYRMRNVYINPNYNPIEAVTDSTYNNVLDTLQYRGLNIIYENRPSVRKEFLRELVNIYPNDIYRAQEVNKTYNNIMRLGFYKSASIMFNETKSVAPSFITYIGSDANNESAAKTKEEYLDCTILCTPALKQSYKVELEASTNSNFYAFKVTAGYQNRNILRGTEILDVSLTTGYEIRHGEGDRSSYEIGSTVGLSFPTLLTPFNVDKYNKLNNPTTRVAISFSSQRRQNYERTISGLSWGYSWDNGKNSMYTLRPIDLSLVKMGHIDSLFINNLDTIGNTYLKNSYESQFIAGISASYTYNNQKLNSNANSIIFKLNLETSGNLANGLTNLFNSKTYDGETGRNFHKILGIRYAQYVRLQSSFSNKIQLGEKSSIVYRLLAGAALSYGNSDAVPYDRLFYSGGSNSMRGWMVRTLGPGNQTTNIKNSLYHSQLGNLKLETNLEFRFPVWDMLHGALFFDLGNVWYMKEGEAPTEGVFHFNSFYKQLGFNTGLGARIDLDFLVLRLDWGIKLHNPNLPAGNRWINSFKFKDTTALNFGVGYPF